MIKLKVTKPIYIRKGPGTNYDSLGVVYPGGKDLIVDGKKEDGQAHKGISGWYHLTNDKGELQWYWEGGIREGIYNDKEKDFLNDNSNTHLHGGSPDEQNWKVSWAHVDLEVFKIWKEFDCRGENAKIAILDNGIPALHPDLNVSPQNCFYPFSDGGSVIDDSSNFHGSMCAGIAAAQGNKFVYGIAPEANLFIGKINSRNGNTLEGIKMGLQWARSKRVDIISISTVMVSDLNNPLQKDIQDELIKCKQENIEVFCAIGNSGRLGIPQENIFPAAEVACIGIGGYRKFETTRNPRITISKSLQFLLPSEKILTTNNKSADVIGELSSVAAPLMAGIIALFINAIKKGLIKVAIHEVVKQLYETGIPVEEHINSNKYNYRIPQPYLLFQTLTK